MDEKNIEKSIKRLKSSFFTFIVLFSIPVVFILWWIISLSIYTYNANLFETLQVVLIFVLIFTPILSIPITGFILAKKRSKAAGYLGFVFSGLLILSGGLSIFGIILLLESFNYLKAVKLKELETI